MANNDRLPGEPWDTKRQEEISELTRLMRAIPAEPKGPPDIKGPGLALWKVGLILFFGVLIIRGFIALLWNH